MEWLTQLRGALTYMAVADMNANEIRSIIDGLSCALTDDELHTIDECLNDVNFGLGHASRMVAIVTVAVEKCNREFQQRLQVEQFNAESSEFERGIRSGMEMLLAELRPMIEEFRVISAESECEPLVEFLGSMQGAFNALERTIRIGV